jgi:hypothetical protein
MEKLDLRRITAQKKRMIPNQLRHHLEVELARSQPTQQLKANRVLGDDDGLEHGRSRRRRQRLRQPNVLSPPNPQLAVWRPRENHESETLENHQVTGLNRPLRTNQK